MAGELVVDARYLEPPEPFVKAMEALDLFEDEDPPDAIRVLLFREPFPLYKVLEENGFSRQTTLEDDGTYVIVIRRRLPA